MRTRREFIGLAAAALVGPHVWSRYLAGAASTSTWSDSLGPPDQFGLRLQPGFTGRLLARSGAVVSGTDYVWHGAPDGGAVFADATGGWVYISNSELNHGAGGASTLIFDADGDVIGAQSILTGTSRNCAGGATPWGTWLSCEEAPLGQVYECDPFVPGSGVVRPALGSFEHEAAVVDASNGDVYLTEDEPDGRLYRFVPTVPGDLSAGVLYAARLPVSSASLTMIDSVAVEWVPTSASSPDRVAATTAFSGGEGAWIDGDRLLFTTKGDCRVWSLHLRTQFLSVLHDCVASPDTPLDDVDNIVVHQGSGDVYIAEDAGDMQLCVLREYADGAVAIEAFLQVVGQDASEITGPAFSPDGQRLYFSSQRGTDGNGLIYEVSGPFPRPAPGLAPIGELRRADRLDA